MPTRNVVLTDQLSDFVDRMVAGGTYQNASEVLREGLRRLQREEEVWEKAKAGVLEGLEQIRRGETVDGEEAFARILERHFPE
jgi:antitoxin ParD1/3/4